MVTYFQLLPWETRRKIERGWEQTPQQATPVVLKPVSKKPGDFVVMRPLQGRKPNRGYEEGIAAEERFFELCRRYFVLGRFPAWYLGMLRGTVYDDTQGIDAKARVLIREKQDYVIPVQIKSSEEGRKRFRAKPEQRHIPCIVVNDWRSDDEVFTTLVEEITFVREQVLLAGR
jgi:hypothetical protein